MKALTCRIKDGKTFLATFAPDRNYMLVMNKEAVHYGSGKYGTPPSLLEIIAAYGYDTAHTLVYTQLFALSEHIGCREKLTEKQISDMAHAILNFDKGMTVPMFIYFIEWTKSSIAADYGVEFYGTVDAMKIRTALAKFKKFAMQEREEIDRKREKERRAKTLPVNPVPFEEYAKLKDAALNGDKAAAERLGWSEEQMEQLRNSKFHIENIQQQF